LSWGDRFKPIFLEYWKKIPLKRKSKVQLTLTKSKKKRKYKTTVLAPYEPKL